MKISEVQRLYSRAHKQQSRWKWDHNVYHAKLS